NVFTVGIKIDEIYISAFNENDRLFILLI
ncbi:hypothetical protein O340_02790, partial [Staphylococcus aureus M0164]